MKIRDQAFNWKMFNKNPTKEGKEVIFSKKKKKKNKIKKKKRKLKKKKKKKNLGTYPSLFLTSQ